MRSKKCITMLLATMSISSMMLLSACQSEAKETNKQPQAAATATAEATVSPTTEATVFPTDAATPEAAATPATEATATPAANTSTGTYKPGTLTKDEYKSEYIGISFKANSKYGIATKKQMETAFGAGAKIAYGDKGEQVQELSKDMVTYEMMATAAKGFPNVNIGVQKSLIPNMAEQQFFDSLKMQLESLKTMEAKVGKASEVQFCGEKYLMAPVAVKIKTVEVSERVYIRKKDDNFIFITLSGQKGGEKDMDDLMNNFKQVK